MSNYNVLILGASYGSLLATKLLLAGHDVTLVCRTTNAESINRNGIRVRLPINGRREPVEVDSRELRGKLSACSPGSVDPREYDLVALAMQEPHYSQPGVRELLDAVAISRVPCMSIMNMPPPPYLARIPGLDVDALDSCYTDARVWRNFDPGRMTLCSPDPQAFRLSDQAINIVEVTLPTNFKAARFESDEDTEILRRIQAHIAVNHYHEFMELPVKLKLFESIFVPLAKWPMLITGNYRCVQRHDARTIYDAVWTDAQESKNIYNWVSTLCISLGASQSDLVPFEKYAEAARDLTRPSSAARALFNGATEIERVDRLVQAIAMQEGLHSPVIDEIVGLVDARLALNHQRAVDRMPIPA